MSLSILNNIPALQAENQLTITTTAANKSLQELSSGSRINSGSDDAAGLAISDGLNANVAALNQSSLNATNAVGSLQTADGALSQVTALLNRSVTLATEASSSGLSTSQSAAINTEFQALLTQIGNIGTTTNFNGTAVFGSTVQHRRKRCRSDHHLARPQHLHPHLGQLRSDRSDRSDRCDLHHLGTARHARRHR
jgi:flagellin